MRCLLIVLALFLTLPAAGQARGIESGFFDPFAGPADVGARFSDAARSGGSAIRIQIRWASAAPSRPAAARDPEDPAYDWTRYDDQIDAANDQGLEVLVSFSDAPSWAEGRGRPSSVAAGSWQVDARATGDFATAIARRYRDRIEQVQVWNEPNLDRHLAPQYLRGKPFAAPRFRAMLNAAYPGVHAEGLDLVAGGTAPYGDPGQGSRIRPLTFWKQLLRKRVRFDVAAHHPYSIRGPRAPAYDRNDIAIAGVKRIVRLVRKRARAGAIRPRGTKPLWVTEVSWDSNKPDPDGVPMRKLTRWVSQTFEVLWRQRVARVYWFGIRDQPPHGNYAATFQSGMYFADGRRKPAERAFRFPLSCRATGAGLRVFVRAPTPGQVSLRTKGGRVLKRVFVGKDRVAVTSVKHPGPIRARQAGTNSPPCGG